MSHRSDNAWQVGRLLHWALDARARPALEDEYRQLLERYLDDAEFRDMVRDTADGLGLEIVDVSEHGVVLVPDEHSTFALKPADFRPGTSKADDRLLDGLIQVAIAATLYPRARDLDDDIDVARAPLTVDEVDEQVRLIADGLAQRVRLEPDPDADDELRGLTEAWRVYLRLQPGSASKRSGGGRRTTTHRAIERAFERLREFGCFVQSSRGQDIVWQSTRRYQVMVQKLAATRIFAIVQQALADESEATPGIKGE